MAAMCVRYYMRSLPNLANFYAPNVIRPTSVRTLTTQLDKNQTSMNDGATKQDQKPAENAKTEEKPVNLNEEDCIKFAEEIQNLETKLADINDKYKRSLADAENLRVRTRKQLEETRRYAIQGFCKDLLEVADVLEKATESVPAEDIQSGKNPQLKSLFEGLTMMESQLQQVFTRNGLVRMDPIGEKFDPHKHEALFTQPFEDKEPGTIAIVTKVGYELHDRVVRPPLVGVVEASS